MFKNSFCTRLILIKREKFNLKYSKFDLFYLFMAFNNIFLKKFILNSSYVTVNFQEVMVQLAPRVTIR